MASSVIQQMARGARAQREAQNRRANQSTASAPAEARTPAALLLVKPFEKENIYARI